MTDFYLGDDLTRMTAAQEWKEDERLRMENETQHIEPFLCRTCHDPINSDGDEDHDQCPKCRLETP